MKLTITTLCLFLSLFLFAEENITVKSNIEQVTIFKKGAQVVRKAKQSLSSGKQRIIFSGLTANLDKNSIQLKAEGQLTVLSVSHQLNYIKAQEIEADLKQLRGQIRQLRDSVEEQKLLIKVYEEEESFIIANKSIRGSQNGIVLEDLREIAGFYRNRFKEIKFSKLDIKRNIKSLNQKIQQLDNQLKEFANKKGTSTSEVVVLMDVKTNTTANFTLSYLVNTAGWYATYDARVKNVNSPLQLAYNANVYQSSGEDWKEVKLILSTGNPNQNSVRPELKPWRLNFILPRVVSIRGSRSSSSNYYIDGVRVAPGVYNGLGNANSKAIEGRILDQSGEPLIGANILIKGTSIGVATDFDGFYRIDNVPLGAQSLTISYTGYTDVEAPISSSTINIVMEEGVSLDEVVVTRSPKVFRKSKKKKRNQVSQPVASTTIEQATTTEFQIAIPYTIPANGKNQLVHIQDYNITSDYQYYSAPKLDPHAYLTANLTDWEQYNLLSGDANLFFEGTFLGRSFLDVENTDDTLSLSLGQDQNIVISRTKEKDFSDRKFLSNKKVDSRTWKIDIRNKKNTKINLIIEDQFPIASNDQIEVMNKNYEGAQLNEDTGILKWQFDLNPTEQKTVEFTYEVKYPKKKMLKLE